MRASCAKCNLDFPEECHDPVMTAVVRLLASVIGVSTHRTMMYERYFVGTA
jgi:hypothetical protein